MLQSTANAAAAGRILGAERAWVSLTDRANRSGRATGYGSQASRASPMY